MSELVDFLPTRDIVVLGTGTGVGKTYASAAVLRETGLGYWKPVQTGTDSDTSVVSRLTGNTSMIYPPVWLSEFPMSPYDAGEKMGEFPDPGKFLRPVFSGPLIIESAGGVASPMTRDFLMADLVPWFGATAILVAPLVLGGISAAITALEFLQYRGICLSALLFSPGDFLLNTGTIRRFRTIPAGFLIPEVDQDTTGFNGSIRRIW